MIHTRSFGAPGGLPTVMAHCFLGHSGSWASLVAAMRTPLDVVAFDLPGHGRSPMPDVPGDFHANVADLITSLVTRPALLVGHSFGAASMLRHALRHPATAKGLVLIEPVFFAVAKDQPEYPPYIESEGPMRRALALGDLDLAALKFLQLNIGSPDWNTLPPEARAKMSAQMPLVGAAIPGLYDDSGGLLEPGVMEAFDCPVLVILGARTSPIFFAEARELIKRLPRAHVASVAGAGHMVPITDVDEVARLMDDWLVEVGIDSTTTA